MLKFIVWYLERYKPPFKNTEQPIRSKYVEFTKLQHNIESNGLKRFLQCKKDKSVLHDGVGDEGPRKNKRKTKERNWINDWSWNEDESNQIKKWSKYDQAAGEVKKIGAGSWKTQKRTRTQKGTRWDIQSQEGRSWIIGATETNLGIGEKRRGKSDKVIITRKNAVARNETKRKREEN